MALPAGWLTDRLGRQACPRARSGRGRRDDHARGVEREPGRPARAAGARRFWIQRAESGDRKGRRGLVPAARARHRDGHQADRTHARRAGGGAGVAADRARLELASCARDGGRALDSCPPSSSRSSTDPRHRRAGARRRWAARSPSSARSSGVRPCSSSSAAASRSRSASPRCSPTSCSSRRRRSPSPRCRRAVPRARAGGRDGRPRPWGVVSDRSFGGRRAAGRRRQRGDRRGRVCHARARSAPAPLAVVPLALVAGAGAFGWVGLYFALVAEIGGPRYAGLLTGAATACSWSGTLIGPPIFGVAARDDRRLRGCRGSS